MPFPTWRPWAANLRNRLSPMFQQMFFNGSNPANVTAQPFFETALGGAGSAYCAGYSSCTAALVSKNTALFKETAVCDMWNAMTKAPSWTLGRTIFSQPVPGGTVGQATSSALNTSLGFGNYNAVFVSFRTTNWHGLTAISNFTWGRSLGTASQIQATSSATPLDAVQYRRQLRLAEFRLQVPL